MVESSNEHFLAESDNVRGPIEVEVLVAPHFASGASASLHLVDEQRGAVLPGHLLQTLEELGRALVVAALGLDGLDYDAGHRTALLGKVLEQLLHLGQAPLVLGGVLAHVLLQRIPEDAQNSSCFKCLNLILVVV